MRLGRVGYDRSEADPMSEEPKQDLPDKDSPAQTMLRRIGVAILVVGLSAAAWVFATAPAADESAAAGDTGPYVAGVDNSKRYRLELERIGGKSAVVTAEFSDWFDSLWHGRKLAGTLAVLAVGSAWLCFLLAKIPPLDDGGQDR